MLREEWNHNLKIKTVTPDEIRNLPGGLTLKIYHEHPTDSTGSEEGWVCHGLDLHDSSGQIIGYIKLEYVPSQRFEKVCPTPWHIKPRYRDLVQDPRKLWIRAHRDLLVQPASLGSNFLPYKALEYLQKNVPEDPQKDLEVLLQDPRILGPYEDWRRKFVDRPSVGYIYVREEFQGRGLGTLLYVEASRWLAESFGLTLRASTLQSKAAKRSWASMKRKGYPVYLIPSLSHPENLLPVLDFTDPDDIKADVPLHLLSNWNPLRHPPWYGCQDKRIFRRDIEKAEPINLTDRPKGMRHRTYHIRRIAHFVKYGWVDPISLEFEQIGNPTISEGNHRLAAAFYMRHPTIFASFYGDIGSIESYLPGFKVEGSL